MDVNVREYLTENIQALSDLMIELGYPSFVEEMMQRMSDIYTNSNYKTMVATKEGNVVGMIGLVNFFFGTKWFLVPGTSLSN